MPLVVLPLPDEAVSSPVFALLPSVVPPSVPPLTLSEPPLPLLEPPSPSELPSPFFDDDPPQPRMPAASSPKNNVPPTQCLTRRMCLPLSMRITRSRACHQAFCFAWCTTTVWGLVVLI